MAKPKGYWDEANTLWELKLFIEKTGEFPTQDKLTVLNRQDLLAGIRKNGGFIYFRKLLNFNNTSYKERGFWNDNTIIADIKLIIEKLNKFPTTNDLKKLHRTDLITAIINNGGFPKFRKLLNIELLSRERHYWNEGTIISELNDVAKILKHFPSYEELRDMGKSDLIYAIQRFGSKSYFKKLLHFELTQDDLGFWTDVKIVDTLKEITKNIGYFPSLSELREMKRSDLYYEIQKHGGHKKFRELCGHSEIDFKSFCSDMGSYNNKRGRSSEKIVLEIITKYCELKNIPLPEYNVKLTEGNVIEFVCDLDKKIGIDVTNTSSRTSVTKKWRHKVYHEHLSELWIVVFSDVFTEKDYINWNNVSPYNVKIFSIDKFIEELSISIDENTKEKIDKFKQCSFRTKEELKSESEYKDTITNDDIDRLFL